MTSPVFDKDYAPCLDMFSRDKWGASSEVIDIVEVLSQISLPENFVPSHTWTVIDETIGIEASTEGVAYFPLSKYFNDPNCVIMCGWPNGMTQETVNQILALADTMAHEGLGYDYGGLIGDAIEGLLHLDDLIPELRKIADPLHSSHALFCSALVSTLKAATAQYGNIPLFRGWTVSKISPLLLYNQFPYSHIRKIKDISQEVLAQMQAMAGEGPEVSRKLKKEKENIA